MDFFDDFSDTSINTSKWAVSTSGGGSVSEGNGYISVYANAGYANITGKKIFTTPEIITEKLAFVYVGGGYGDRDRSSVGQWISGDNGVFHDGQVFWYPTYTGKYVTFGTT